MTKSIKFISELDPYLDTEANDTDTVLEFICQICRKGKLAIPTLTEAFNVGSTPSIGSIEPLSQLSNLYVQGYERIVVFPCGHIVGDKCVRKEQREQRDLACPSCGFRMVYTNCGHAIAPAILPASCAGSVRDTFPLTIPEGGRTPSNCKECRWVAIQAKIRYALNSECVICTQRSRAGVQLENPIEHDEHRSRHVNYGIRRVLDEIMMLVQPEFITRTTKDSVQKATEERDQRNVNTALLNAMALTEREDTVWHRTTTKQLTRQQARTHTAGVRAIQHHILGLLMHSGKNCRRMW
ncbi:hypothetical protein F4860DRAFT_503579 [Xylaria cubensis]|nr:hypothetical protein F4860DRAFT_503579 [Xylaria cubensis]